jgi:6-pyruvoyltetrahydropterin/6-carboxytetrahydropterin synthase
MKLRVNKTFHFEAHHKLPYHRGKCKNDHGHSYKVELCVRGEIKPDNKFDAEAGMVVDFDFLKQIWKGMDANATLDHGSLNRFLDNPTAERLCEWIVLYYTEYIKPDVELVRVRVHETADSYVEWNADD